MSRSFFRDNGLTLVLTAMFAMSVAGMIFTGQAAYNKDLTDHGAATVDLVRYLQSGNFLSALFENWESEFLQMAVYVVLTAMLFQRGSAESRDPDDPHRPGDRWNPRRWPPIVAWIYERSLGITLALLLPLLSACIGGLALSPPMRKLRVTACHPVRSSSIWAIQNCGLNPSRTGNPSFYPPPFWLCSPYFSATVGSPESKPVSATNSETSA